MSDRETLKAIIFSAVDEINLHQPDTSQLEKSDTAVLFGHGTVLDSIGLVNLIVSIEQRIDDEFGITLTLANDRALSQVKSPFRTIKALSDYTLTLLDEAKQ